MRTPESDPTTAATPFSITVDNRTGETVVAVSGELDVATAPRLAEALRCLCRPEAHRTVLDCSGLTFCDSSGLTVLVRAHQARAGCGGHLTITASPHVLQRLLDMTGIEDYLDTATGTRPTPAA